MATGTINIPHPTPGLEYKATTVTEETGLIGADDDTGVVEAIVSVTGVCDHDNDIIEPGAYKSTLTKRRPKGIFSHDWGRWASRTESIEELLPGDSRLTEYASKMGKPWPAQAGGLYVRTRYNLATQTGRDAYNDVKFFSETGECEWSVGYKVPPGKGLRGKDGVRRIKEMDLFEYSPVLFGSASLSGTLSVKSTPTTETELDEMVSDIDWDAIEIVDETDEDDQEALADIISEDEPNADESGEEDDGEETPAEAEPEETAEPEADDQPDEATEGEPTEDAGEGKSAPVDGKKPAPRKSGSGAQAATPGGDGDTWKIRNVEELRAAVRGFGGVKESERDKVRAHIVKRAFALNRPDLIPEDWKKKPAKKATTDADDLEGKREFAPQQRRELAKEGTALPDGSYPIKTVEDLKNAIKAYGRAKPEDRDKVRRHIIKRARALGHPELIPDAWKSGGEKTDDGTDEVKRMGAGLDRSPRKNWVEMTGRLPGYIEEVAKSIHQKRGVPLENAIPMAISQVKKWCAGGDNVNADTRTKACKAVSEWEALKARNAARRAAKAAAMVNDLDLAADDVEVADAPQIEALPHLPGTYEELKDLLHTEATVTLTVDEPYLVEVLGTWPDRAVVTRYVLGGEHKAESFEVPYDLSEGAVTLGNPVPVTITVDSGGEKSPGEDLLPHPAMIENVTAMVKSLLAAEETKAGRVLSGANANRLKAAVEQLIAVLTAAGIELKTPEEEPEEQVPVEEDSTAPSVRGDRVPVGKTLVDPAVHARAYRILGEAHVR